MLYQKIRVEGRRVVEIDPCTLVERQVGEILVVIVVGEVRDVAIFVGLVVPVGTSARGVYAVGTGWWTPF